MNLVYNFSVQPAIMLFAKAPVAGRVKTRLAPLLGAAGAAELHRAFVSDMLELLAGLAGIAGMELHTDTPTDAWLYAPVAGKLQCAGNLGQRMFHALNAALVQGHPRAMVVGSDAPTLPRKHLEMLLDSAADVAFGPCEDGGYYAISCRRVHPAMFHGVDWSTAGVLAASERAARACGLTVERGAPWFDVDEPPDLARLLRSPALPRFTGAWLIARGGMPPTL
jgi:rSAM/selenodomain-associated transferase 1